MALSDFLLHLLFSSSYFFNWISESFLSRPGVSFTESQSIYGQLWETRSGLIRDNNQLNQMSLKFFNCHWLTHIVEKHYQRAILETLETLQRQWQVQRQRQVYGFVFIVRKNFPHSQISIFWMVWRANNQDWCIRMCSGSKRSENSKGKCFVFEVKICAEKMFCLFFWVNEICAEKFSTHSNINILDGLINW